ncbi:MAG: flagellar protein FlaG [Zetaproteobacteria bacterium]|nr:flagellar protein FlaG [Zetaproteobacteria bacterium]
MEAISQISNQSSAVSASLGSSLSSSVASFSNRQQAQASLAPLQKISEAMMSEQAVKGVIKQANQALQSQNIQSSVSFGYEAKLGQMFVQIHDGETGSVIGEFPSKSSRALQIAMNEIVGLLLDKKG